MPSYLCKARSPWQRGTNENTDRLLRQYLPKGADLRTFSQEARPTWTPSPMSSTIARARPMATALRQRSTLTS
ncbi:integrase [Streptomyces hygroscopicus]|nr:integrase [Streptomyces hygroscopicus]